jgi:putative transcriptional regulator
MSIHTGMIIKSTAALAGTDFENSRILITSHDSTGATGFIVNKPYHRAFNELEEYKHSVAFPLYNGGPVGTAFLYFIHQRPDWIEGGTDIGNGLYFAGSFKQAVTAINNKSLTAKDIKIFIGYCGWDTGELEAEIAEGSWTLEEDFIEPVFFIE